jgi:hypothetical protein
MPTILKTKNSVTTTVAPTTLQQGELAVNITDKKMWVGNAATTPVQIVGTGSGGGGAAGSNTQVQYNSSGALAGDADFTFNGTTVTMANDASISGLTVGKGLAAVATNTALGNSVLNANTTGNWSTGVGYQSLISNTTGSNNTAVGMFSLYTNTTGSDNVGVGLQSLFANTTGGSNTALGRQALGSNTTASNNTAVGYQAGYSNTTGAQSTYIGMQAGYSVTTGTYNAFFGYASGVNITTGTKNTIIGSYNGNQGGLDIRTLSNWIVLSDGDGNPRARWSDAGAAIFRMNATDTYSFDTNNATTTRPYGVNIQFGGTAPNNTTQTFLDCQDTTNTKLTIYSNGTVSNRTGTYNTLSDVKLKENIADATPKLNKLMDVKVRNYNLIGDELKQIGFVAQELETIFPALIDNVPDLDENKQPTGEVTKGVKLTVMIPILVKAIQELKAEFDAYKATHP